MKKPIMIKSVLILLVFIANFSCKTDDGGTTTPLATIDLIEVAKSEANLSTLLAAIERANLTSTLQGGAKLTVLAPTDIAFNAFLAKNRFGSINDVPVEILEQLLLNHILQGPIDLANLEVFDQRYTQTSAENQTSGFNFAIYFDTTDGVVFNSSSKITKSDIFASNGIIHIVDNVIEIPTIESFVIADNELSSLKTALELIASTSTLPAAIGDAQSGNYTLFAPSNIGFDALLNSNSNWNTLGDIDESLLKSIVEHHVLNEEVRTQGLAPSTSFSTLEGDDINLNFLDGRLEITDGSETAGRIVKITDIQAVNGIIHILEDQALMPNTTN